MENKEAKQQSETTLTPTGEQPEQAKQTTSQSVTELKVEAVEERANPGWLMTPAGS